MGFLSTYNTVTKFAAFPCAEPSPFIIAITLIPAITPALMEWVSFGCRDIMKFRLGKGAPCGRMMKAQVAKAIPPSFVSTVDKLLKFESKFSQAGQMFLLADLASDTIQRWTTLAYQWSGCPDANNYTSWDIKYSAPNALDSNVPTIIGGAIHNLKGNPAYALPTGASVPPGWYFQVHFRVQAWAIFSHQGVNLTTWLRRENLGAYDFEANRYPAGYALVPTTGQITMTTQNTATVGHAVYSMIAMSQELALTTELEASCSVSEFPPVDYSLSPLGCLSNIGVEHVDDPLNRNPKSRYPGVVARFIGEHLPTPARGPPGGRPRSKK